MRIGVGVRPVVGVLVALVSLLGAAPGIDALSRGTFFVFDSPDCTGNGNAPKVTVPFSVGGRSYPANTEMEIYATDKRADETFGPFTVTTNADGAFCARVNAARETQWKIDLVEPGSGFTDSKVIWVEPATPTPTTVPVTTTIAPTTTTPATTSAPTTTTPSPTTTVSATTTIPGSTTVPGSTTTVVGVTTTTTAVTTTTGPGVTTTDPGVTTTGPVIPSSSGPEVEPPFEIEQVPLPPTTPVTSGAPGTSTGAVTLPASGPSSSSGVAAAGVALLAIGALAVLVAGRRQRRI